MAFLDFLKKNNMTEKDEEFKLKSQAERGDSEAMFQLGCLFDHQGQYDYAEKWWLKAIENGHSQAKYCLALNYKGGMGGPFTMSKAIQYFTELADEGCLDACKQLGNIYCMNNEFNPFFAQFYDLKKAAQYFLVVVKSGDPDVWLDTALYLGLIYAGQYIMNNIYRDETLTDPLKAAYLFFLTALNNEDTRYIYIPKYDEVVAAAHLNITDKILHEWQNDYEQCKFNM